MESLEKEAVSPERVMEELAAIGFAKATDYLQVQGKELVVLDTCRLPERRTAAIASIERTNSGLKVKFYDKLKALELLGKHFQLFDGASQTEGKGENLLEAIVQATKEVISTCDIQELQQAAASGDDMVEQAEPEDV